MATHQQQQQTLVYKYFDIVGRGETIRILLHAANGKDWNDVRLKFAEWAAVKPNTPLGQIPSLTVDGTEFCQSVAIQRYLAKQVGLYPQGDDDAFQALIVDEAMDIMSECMAKNPQAGTNDEKKIARQAFQANVMTKFFGLVEARIQQFGGQSKDTICGVASVADINLMMWFNVIQSGFFDHIDTDFFAIYPGITACAQKAAESDIVKAYYASIN